MTIKWKYSGNPAEPGYWESLDGRFSIGPQYMGTTRPQGYMLYDNLAISKADQWRDATSTHDTVRECKMHAEDLL